MLIVGAGGLARGVLEIASELGLTPDLAFFADPAFEAPTLLFGAFSVLRSTSEVLGWYAAHDRRMCVAVGDPAHRQQLAERFAGLGGDLVSLVSPRAHVASFDVVIGPGSIIMPGAFVDNGVRIGKSVLVSQLCSVGHDVGAADYVSLCPGAVIGGGAKLGPKCFVGSGSIVLPSTEVGANAVIGAGAVVTKAIPAGETVAGVPARAMRAADISDRGPAGTSSAGL